MFHVHITYQCVSGNAVHFPGRECRTVGPPLKLLCITAISRFVWLVDNLIIDKILCYIQIILFETMKTITAGGKLAVFMWFQPGSLPPRHFEQYSGIHISRRQFQKLFPTRLDPVETNYR